MLRVLRGDLRGVDLSRVSIRQAFLREVEAQDMSLVGARVDDAVLAEPFDYPSAVCLNDDGTLLAAGTSTGEICLWRVAERTLMATLQGHTGLITSLSLGREASLRASALVPGRLRPGAAR